MLDEKIQPQVRLMQIVIVAMVVVPLIFAGVVLVIGSQAPQRPAPIRGEVVAPRGAVVVERVALVTGLVALVVQQWMGPYVTRQAVNNLAVQAMSEPERLAEAFLAGTVVSGAICELAAFLNLIAYMSSQSAYNFGMGLLLIATNALKFPTAAKVAAWAEATAKRLRK